MSEIETTSLSTVEVRRKIVCLLRLTAFMFIAELAAFKFFVVLFRSYDFLPDLIYAVFGGFVIVIVAALGLLEETLLTFLVLLGLLVFLPGTDLFLSFYDEHYSALLLHFWVPIYFCREDMVAEDDRA